MIDLGGAPLRVRFAPSPTGSLHVGGARTALFNVLLARRLGGTTVLRFEDTDETRSVPGSEEGLLADLAWLGFVFDEDPVRGGPFAPYRQSERLAIYRDVAERLVSLGRAYRCYCTAEELESERRAQLQAGVKAPRYNGRCRTLEARERERFEREGRPAMVRFTVEPGETVVHDLIHGDVRFEHQYVADFVILKSNGWPTYNLAAAVDDEAMEITLVLRADEHLPNTPAQRMILDALGLRAPRYAHVPLILNAEHQKLSKRHQTVGVGEFREQGFLPQALINYLAFLGWSPEGERELYGFDELVQAFSLERVHHAPAVFDERRLRWFNRQYLHRLPRAELERMLADAFRHAGLVQLAEGDAFPAGFERWVSTFVDAYGEGLETAADAVPIARDLRAESAVIPARRLEELRDRNVLYYLDSVRQYVFDVDRERAREGIRTLHDLPLSQDLPVLAAEYGLKKKDAFRYVRLALTGEEHGAPLNLLFPLLGAARIDIRLADATRHVLHGRGLEKIEFDERGRPVRKKPENS
ncbi:MAG TPA: glutamate--tRNA ligase [Candidatus Dormibacteraeota bacterium]|nr:glutamate--tRNA ligase [Candidatus Dormibacteraeota bacterium]